MREYSRVESDTSFAAVLKALRLRAGLTQQQLAEKSGVALTTITSWETRRRQPANRSAIERVASVLDLSKEEQREFLTAAGVVPEREGLVRKMAGKRTRLSDMSDWLNRYDWPCLILNERYELVAWNRSANAVSEADLLELLPNREQRSLLWMAVLPHYRDVRLTNWNELIGRLISFMKPNGLTLDGSAPTWINHLVVAIAQQYPDVLQRLWTLFGEVPAWIDGTRNIHPVEWRVSDGTELQFDYVGRIWNAHDGLFVIDWHPANAQTWEWLHRSLANGVPGAEFMDPPKPWNQVLEACRKSANVSRTELAERSGIARPSIVAYEHGVRRPSRIALLAIARALAIPAQVTNDILEALGHELVPSDFACWVAGVYREVPITIQSANARPQGETWEVQRQECENLTWPAIILDEKCEVAFMNRGAHRIFDLATWPGLANPKSPHLLNLILSEYFLEHCPNWDDVVRAIVPVELEPTVLGREEGLTKSRLTDIVRDLRKSSPKVLRQMTAAWEHAKNERCPRVMTDLQWIASDGELLSFHCGVDGWNTYDAKWALDLHPADSATWRWMTSQAGGRQAKR